MYVTFLMREALSVIHHYYNTTNTVLQSLKGITESFITLTLSKSDTTEQLSSHTLQLF